jgi:multidrug efflux pump subunit AcrA (membrane-fusion protein)
VVQNQTAQKRPIEIGASHGDQIEIRGGLTEGEIVLLSAGDVKEGQTVRPRIQTAG